MVVASATVVVVVAPGTVVVVVVVLGGVLGNVYIGWPWLSVIISETPGTVAPFSVLGFDREQLECVLEVGDRLSVEHHAHRCGGGRVRTQVDENGGAARRAGVPAVRADVHLDRLAHVGEALHEVLRVGGEVGDALADDGDLAVAGRLDARPVQAEVETTCETGAATELNFRPTIVTRAPP